MTGYHSLSQTTKTITSGFIAISISARMETDLKGSSELLDRLAQTFEEIIKKELENPESIKTLTHSSLDISIKSYHFKDSK